MRLRTTLTALVAVCAGIPAVAAAQVHTVSDPSGDVVVGGRVKPGVGAGDITSVRTAYRPNEVKISVELRENPFPAFVEIRGDVKVPRSRFMHQFLVDGGRNPLFIYDRQGAVVRCPGVSDSISRDMRRITLSIPAKCLERPRWVRTSLMFWTEYGGHGSTFDTAATRRDDAPAPLGPRVRRG
ncbi:hypothetical protein GCM10023340_09780 [Nocardioides marinquilinus]|uniref:Uncharacterized protein n=1 Tax=Nocardioides marinquilinus TaxID=1210400 RepID=A0ABP9PBI1_9ACTN